jgi:hypothetical protein
MVREIEPLRKEPRRVVIVSWDVSATGNWCPRTGLHELRDRSPSELAEWLWEWGSYPQNSAIIELIAHGNPRKAAELARALVAAYPITEDSIRRELAELADYLLTAPLESIPGSPSEFPSGANVQLPN